MKAAKEEPVDLSYRRRIMGNLFELIRESSFKYPYKRFIKCTEGLYTYEQVYKRALALSQYFLRAGIDKGDRVILFLNNSVHYIEAFFGIVKINAIAVPVNPAKLSDSIRTIIEKCKPKLILTSNLTSERLDKIIGNQDIRQVNMDELQELPFDGNEDSAGDGDEDNPALILFTSGTTHQPKGVTLTHRNLLANTQAINDYLKLTSEDSVLMTLPFSYSYGNSILLTHTSVGATLILENSTTYPSIVLEGISKHQVSGFSTVGSYIHLMLKYIASSKSSANHFKSLRYITFAGESTNYNDIVYLTENYPDIEVFIMYGQTEASARLSYLEPELLHVKKGSVGKGLMNVELKVVSETGALVKPGEIGEILARGPSIMTGYWEDQAATCETVRDGWLHTGDQATVDEEGYIYIRGRKTDMIKFMGHRISPLEIESVINSCSSVKESAVVESSQNGIPAIKAFLILENPCPVESIRHEICSKLPMYMRPQMLEVVKELPRTDNGKIKRSELRKLCVE